MSRFITRFPFVMVLVGVLLTAMLRGEDPPTYAPPLAKASDEGQKAIKRFKLPAGVEAKVWAAEPLLANPVSFSFDEKGRCFVAETFRLHHGVTDNRKHMYWLDDDIACRTVEDRVAMYRKHAKDKFTSTYEKEHDRVRLVVDSTGAGVADKSYVFADGFHHAAQGIGSGVLARNGNVYYTNIPDLWLLKDAKGKNTADARESLASGFGVHVAFLGHDLHGLRMGPDGRLYFSIGDRGLNVKTKEGKHLFLPDCGAVLRCEPDGSNLEIVHTGLRNPQELAFDEYGNLFTVDNNSDSGDQARLVQIVEGGDSGWRMMYQYGTALGDRGPFNAEKIWHLTDQPAYIVPPLAHIAAGPSGLCYHPGVAALPDKYAGHFFLCDFRGSSGGSGVWAFTVKPKGASFEIGEREQFIWSILATDCDFGPDGGFYISDWTEGWDETGKGRIYRFADSNTAKRPALAEVKKLLAEGFEQRKVDELAKLLEHADQRVRQEAQFALAAKGEAAVPKLAEVAKRQAVSSAERLARFHALWALGQIGRQRNEQALDAIFAAAGDHDSEIRVQALRVLGDVDGFRGAEAMAKLETSLRDAEPRVRFFAVQSTGKIIAGLDEKAQRWAVGELRKLADDTDLYVRRAVMISLSRLSPQLVMDPLSKKFGPQTQSPGVRLATLLALRRQRSVGVAAFLDDPDPQILIEAARACNDEIIPDALPYLAKLLGKATSSEFFQIRALNANFRLGKSEHAAAVAAYAARADAPEKLRVEAVRMLGMWAKPPQRDRVMGDWRPLPERDAKIAVEAMRPKLGGIFAGPDRVRKEAATVAAKLGITEVAATLRAMVADSKQPATSRVEALMGLDSLKDSQLAEVLAAALRDSDARLRAESRRLTALRNPNEAVTLLSGALETGEVIEKQSAFAVLAELKNTAADAVLSKWLDELNKGKVAPELQLDLLDAAEKRNQTALTQRLAAFNKSRPASDHLANWREALVGGDAERGREIFLHKAEVTCVKCHKLNGVGGDVGPDLAGVAKRPTPNGMPLRDYLLESLVLPDKQIAKGYDTVVLELKSGKTVTGVLKSEDAKGIKLVTAEGQPLTIAKQDIEERRRGPSAMPDDLVKKATKRELRDLVEFLAGLK